MDQECGGPKKVNAGSAELVKENQFVASEIGNDQQIVLFRSIERVDR